jgi:hypothetical protein
MKKIFAWVESPCHLCFPNESPARISVWYQWIARNEYLEIIAVIKTS